MGGYHSRVELDILLAPLEVRAARAGHFGSVVVCAPVRTHSSLSAAHPLPTHTSYS
jgi:hypothetical protein